MPIHPTVTTPTIQQSPELIVLLCGGALMAVSAERDGIAVPLPFLYLEALRDRMWYNHLHHLRGADAFDETGHHAVDKERRDLYTFEEKSGRVLCGMGFLNFCADTAGQHGLQVEVRYTDGWFNHPRPDRFKLHWNRVDLSGLRYRQKEILDLMVQYDRACFSAPPGAGKTHTFSNICRLFWDARIKIIVDGASLLEQVYHRLRNAGLPHVGIVYGKEKHFDRITCVSADCMRYIDPADRVSNKGADIYLADEVHLLLAPSHLEPLRQFQYAKLFGLSATIEGRSDGGDRKMESLFGPTVYHMSYQEAESHGLVSPILVEMLRMPVLQIESPAAGKVTQTQKFRSGIWFHTRRNETFAKRMREFGDDVQVVCQVQTVKHAMELKRLLPEYTLVYGETMDMERYNAYVEAGLIDRKAEPPLTVRLRRTLQERFERRDLMKVIATDVWRQGVDFTSLEVVVRADGRTGKVIDYQGPGRASRLHADKSYGLVIDMYDDWDPYFRRLSKDRERNYKKHGWVVTYDQVQPGKRQRA